MLNADRALVLAPHPDDGELGCGGTLAKLAEQGVAEQGVGGLRSQVPDDHAVNTVSPA